MSLEPFGRTRILTFKSLLKKIKLFNPPFYLLFKSKTWLKSCMLLLNFVIWPRLGKVGYITSSNILAVSYSPLKDLPLSGL